MFRGVYEQQWGGSWYATIKHEGKRYHLGTYRKAESAAREYDRAALMLKGKKARLNFPSSRQYAEPYREQPAEHQ
jgi:EREBP-like factor